TSSPMPCSSMSTRATAFRREPRAWRSRSFTRRPIARSAKRRSRRHTRESRAAFATFSRHKSAARTDFPLFPPQSLGGFLLPGQFSPQVVEHAGAVHPLIALRIDRFADGHADGAR